LSQKYRVFIVQESDLKICEKRGFEINAFRAVLSLRYIPALLLELHIYWSCAFTGAAYLRFYIPAVFACSPRLLFRNIKLYAPDLFFHRKIVYSY